MRKNTVISLTATLLAANISFAAPAFADDLQTYNLDTMVVTAQRESKRDVDTPASVTGTVNSFAQISSDILAEV